MRLLKSLLLSFFLVFSQHALAEQWYHVELIVFEHLDNITDEQWPEMTGDHAGTLSPEMASLLIQPANNETLANSAAKLTRSPNYRVHYHNAWRQPILSKSRAKSVNVHSANDLVAGNIRLYKSTYLHAQLDLWLQRNAGLINNWSDTSPQGVSISSPRNPNLEQSQRIRSKKIYYFDHPALSALLQITPIGTPAAAADKIDSSESYSLPTEATATESQ